MTIQNHSAFMSLTRSEVEDDRVTFPLSSEEPYRRWDGNEILVHTASAVDLSFLNSGNAPLLDNHNAYSSVRNVIGVIERAWISKKRLWVTARFSKRADAQAIKADVEDDIIRNVSVGYNVLTIDRGDEDSDDYRVTKWRPFEGSLVTVPADPTVGMGRSVTIRQEAKVMPKDTNDAPDGDKTKLRMPEPLTDEQRAEALQTSIDEITALAKTHNIGDLARSYIRGSLSRGDEPRIEVFRGIARAELPNDTPLVNLDIGLNDKEKRGFSIMRLANAMRDGAQTSDSEAAAFEIEASEAAADKIGKATKGTFVLPTDIMNSWNYYEEDGVRGQLYDPYGRPLNVRAPLGVTGGAGGTALQANPNVQDVEHLAARFIDNLRAEMVMGRLGLTILSGLDGDVEIPGGDQNTQAAWLGSEDADAAESTPTFRKIALTVHDIAAYTDITRRMLMQSTIDIEMYVRAQIVRAMAEGIELAGWYGAGTGGVPEGLANTTGIGSVTFAGAVPTREELIDMDTAIGNTNQRNEPAFVSTTAMGGELRKTRVDTGSGIFLMNRANQLEIGNSFTRTNLITAGDVFAGVFNDMIMGAWGSLELDRSTEAKFLSGGLRLRAIQSVDFDVARVGSFVLGNDGI